MKVLGKHAEGKVLKADGLVYSKIAKEAKKANPNVIDGIIGTYYSEDGKFHALKGVKKMLDCLCDEELYTYSTGNGGKDFQEATINHFLRDSRSYLEKEMDIKCIATPGGTGAVVASCSQTLDVGQTLLIPTPCWGPYFGIASQRALRTKTFNLLKDDKFNFEEFVEKANEIIDEEEKLVFILNDPCNNPTGYTLTEEELTNLIKYLNSTKVPCVMIYDCAYMDVANCGRFATREKFKLFNKCNDNVIVCACVSYSKTYFVYGQRIGGLVILGKNKKAVLDLYNACDYLARNTWSNCNKGMITLVAKIGKDLELRDIIDEELEEVTRTLKRRSSIFLNEANEIGLRTYKYCDGFFIGVPCKDSLKVADVLTKKDIYLLPMDGFIRVAICSLPEKDCYGLASKIKEAIIEGDL